MFGKGLVRMSEKIYLTLSHLPAAKPQAQGNMWDSGLHKLSHLLMQVVFMTRRCMNTPVYLISVLFIFIHC